MPYEKFKIKQEVEAVDIQNMAEMTIDEYKEYLDGGLLFVDHHDILRSEPAGYPLAVTKEQFSALMEYLKSVEYKVGQEWE